MLNPKVRKSAALRERSQCPVCADLAPLPFYSQAYDADPIRSYLESFYDSQLDEEVLTGSRFELCRCDTCGLVFQRWVPNTEFLSYLYMAVWPRQHQEMLRRIAI